ncbi:pentapeptide repeat-containing protein [Streptomyces sp. NPDC058051]|uniref:pentapeptide repeat-containing protein n=1 Tax=Streptomyces sp. NPDC058051 TaxID=3346315 RepID=UPI0036E2F9C6
MAVDSFAGADFAGADSAGADFAGADFSAADAAPVDADWSDALAPSVSFRPGKIRPGFSPTTSRLSWYSFCQPPSTPCSSAIFAR